MEILRRDAMLIPTDQYGNKHLHLVMSDSFRDPLIEGGREIVVVVSLSTYRAPDTERNSICLLQPGDHPFITRTSYVCYHLAQYKEVSEMQKNIQRGWYVRKEPISEAVFQKIYNGFKPPITPNFILESLGLPTLKRY